MTSPPIPWPPSDSDESAAACERRFKVRRTFEERVSDVSGRAPPPRASAVTAVAGVLLLPACRSAPKRAVVIGQVGWKVSKCTPTLVGG